MKRRTLVVLLLQPAAEELGGGGRHVAGGVAFESAVRPAAGQRHRSGPALEVTALAARENVEQRGDPSHHVLQRVPVTTALPADVRKSLRRLDPLADQVGDPRLDHVEGGQVAARSPSVDDSTSPLLHGHLGFVGHRSPVHCGQ